MKRITKANIFFLALIVLQIIGGTIIQQFNTKLRPNFAIALIVTQIVLLIIPNLVYILVTRQSFKKVLRFNPINFKSAFIIILVALFFIPIASFLANFTGLFFRNNVETVIRNMKGTPLLEMIFVLGIVPAFCEELLVRGSILSAYKGISIKKAALINGFLFGVLHLNPPQFLYTFALGTILSYLVYSCDSIFASMIAHFIFNSFSAVVSWFAMRQNAKPTGNAIRNLPANQKIATLLFGAVLAAVALGVIIILIRELMDMNKDKIESQKQDEAVREEYNISDKVIASVPVLFSVILFLDYIYANLYKIL
ncbi:hypothetical protein BJV85_003534 [Clostridium acetobutylicum]|uniref:Conserved membrane protein, possible homolog of CAAX-like membrane endopeptidase n=1 Tax=Clostridium acetobutylicum (strain ATCC 824 / DSM 792 / JCM 1419 / IAM 19013 / LMG 5710 / NBRC 13948 / NRRL B-527 / VKM B-1787 / 2291 / W) TaxID=272562 RepID=Q97LS1_CLOAB|nr:MULTISPECIES: type II CAAX endopeptidase family protein [Clostridium]AAK78463.1 Conserved membrane protein, possible homolog of CAAX-like membrane endopeptidase [Clostridium acetobutylicum ATCC 824]ADZ19533.1 Conserved hypothetical protein [Clostridium acetobutylicum EA 2018]AEI31268.1 membrane endopeptidase [Clostridium acetobutylicum DSM 1731]AWV80185.1 CPBP family intramembrane metalloprotease [Clostridium acetobutylicum]MBC2392366.1 CPBP family intramembrane metalloprotease [Clostridium